MSTPVATPADYSAFTISDLELAFDTLGNLSRLASSAACQPRAYDDVSGEATPAALFIQNEFVLNCDKKLHQLADHLRGIHGRGPDEESRRIQLLMRYELEFGEGSLVIISQLLGAAQPKRKAA